MEQSETEMLDISELLGAESAPSLQMLAIYIPNKDKEGKEIKQQEAWVKRGIKVLSTIGGGVTTMPPSDGTWLDPDKHNNIQDPDQLKDEDLLWEKTIYIYTYIYADKFLQNATHFRRFLHDFGRETNQGEVVFEFDEDFYRIRNYDQPAK